MSKRKEKSSRRVTWAEGANLCQVKLFLPDECPAQVGVNSDNRLQAKTSNMMHPNAVELDDMPPGFEANRFSNSLKMKLPVARVKWLCPLKFVIDENLRVAAGEDSEERVVQPGRDHRTLEAIYPRLTSIPLSPCVSLDVEESEYDDRHTPAVPIIPIEEEEDSLDATDNVKLLAPALEASRSCGPSVPETAAGTGFSPSTVQCVENKPLSGTVTGVGADAAAAASAAFTGLIKARELGSMVDTDLLISILRDPKMIELLRHVHSFDRPRDASQPPVSASFASVLKNNAPESMVDTDLLIKILSDPKMIGLLTDSSIFGGAKTLPMSGLKHATPEPTTSQRTVQPASSAFPIVEPARSQSISYSRMEHNLVSFTKPMINKPLELSSVQKCSNTIPVLDAKVTFPLAPLPPSLDARNNFSTVSATGNFAMPLTSAQQLSGPLHAKLDKTPILNSSSSGQIAYASSPLFASSSMGPIRADGPSYSTKPGTGYVIRNPTPPRLANLTVPVSNVAPSSVPMSIRGVDDIPSSRPSNGFVASTRHGSHPPPSQPVVMPLQSTKVPAMKDLEYYKNLIKQHGTEKQETIIGHDEAQRKQYGGMELGFDGGDMRRKNGRTCAYFNSSKGCRKGSSCPYQHDSFGMLNGSGMEDIRSSKRIKLMSEGNAGGVYY